MTHRHISRKALGISLLAIIVCLAIMAGTTYAWFTDAATVFIDKIQSGSLDIVLEIESDDGWVPIEDETIGFVAANNRSTIRWEPGCTYRLPQLRVRNVGNLALKYRVQLAGIQGNAKLNEVIRWNVVTGSTVDSLDSDRVLAPGACQYLTISATMLPEADSSYAGLTLEGVSVTVYATQMAAETDSYDNQYDADAEYNFTVSTYEQLVSAVNAGGTVTLTNDIVLKEPLIIPKHSNVVLNMDGKTITPLDGTVDPMVTVYSNASLTITGNGTFDLGEHYGMSFLCPYGDVTIENGTYKIASGGSGYGSFFIGIRNGKGKLIINGGYFDGGYYKASDCFNNCRSLLNGSWGQYIRVYGGTFVGQNPAWGDEGMAYLCPHCTHPRENEYCQALFLEGQSRTDTALPNGYTIQEGLTSDNRPTYTVIYTEG